MSSHTRRCLNQPQPDAECICDDRPLGHSDGEVERLRALLRDEHRSQESTARERDEWRVEANRLREERDEARQGSELWHQAAVAAGSERDALKAALCGVLDAVATYSFASSEHLQPSRLGAALQRAREALGEVEK